MRKTVFFATLIALFASFTAIAQRPTVGCIDKSIRLQADEIKHHYTDQGFAVYRDAMVNMESMTPMPVMVEMQKGYLYQIVFVGHSAVSRIKMEVFDGGDHKVDEKFVMRNRQQPNYLIYTFSPQRSDTYLFTFMQKLKNENMCGSLCILKMDSNKKQAEIKPFQQ